MQKIADITEDTIQQVVDQFYTKVRNDLLLAPVFEQAIGKSTEDWRPHLEKLYAFWSSVLLGSGRYHGNPFMQHKELPPFDIGLFDRWLALFKETVYELHTPEIAEIYMRKSTQIAQSLKYGLYSIKNG